VRTADDPSHKQEGILVVVRWVRSRTRMSDARTHVETAFRSGRPECGNQPAHLKLETIAKRSGVRRPHFFVSRTRSRIVPHSSWGHDPEALGAEQHEPPGPEQFVTANSSTRD